MKFSRNIVLSILASILLSTPLVQAESLFGMFTHTVSNQVQSFVSSRSPSVSVQPPAGKDNSLFGEPGALQNEDLCTAQYLDGAFPQILNSTLRNKTKLGCFDHFTVMHSGITRTALWSAERLTRANIAAASKLPREDSFRAEDRLPKNERAELSDYTRSGYDRGHLAPNADEPSKVAQWQSFSLANIVPQNPDNNRNLHAGIEKSVRAWAKQSGELYVITGPLFLSDKLSSLHNRVIIPTHIFKAVYDPSNGVASAYLEKNAPGMEYETISISELQRISGIDFFPTLSDQAKNKRFRLPGPLNH